MDWSQKNTLRTIQILVDNDSWILPFVDRLRDEISQLGHRCRVVRHADQIESGDIVFLLGCTRMVSQSVLKRNARNLVVHESRLPAGRGFAPMSWQVLEGKREIEVCLLEAAGHADAGDVYRPAGLRSGYESVGCRSAGGGRF